MVETTGVGCTPAGVTRYAKNESPRFAVPAVPAPQPCTIIQTSQPFLCSTPVIFSAVPTVRGVFLVAATTSPCCPRGIVISE